MMIMKIEQSEIDEDKNEIQWEIDRNKLRIKKKWIQVEEEKYIMETELLPESDKLSCTQPQRNRYKYRRVKVTR